MTQRTVLRVSGADAEKFLQDLVTNNVSNIENGLVYSALLTPQGKFIADFFLVRQGDSILLDVHSELAPTVFQRLSLYKLRAAVTLEETDIHVHRGLGDPPKDGWADPREKGLGWRAYRDEAPDDDGVDWDALYVRFMIPQPGAELTDDSFILEMGFERLNGVDFRKGCYVGQEVTARMKHKTELRKGLAKVQIIGEAQPGDEILAGEKVAGSLHTIAGNEALAYLRFDRAKGDLQAGNAELKLIERR